MNKIAVLGSNGQLGECFKKELSNSNFKTYFFSKHTLDITNHHKTSELINKLKPNIIINASAYTNVDNAEIESELCNRINNTAVRNLANICKKNLILLIHFSTDYVFDGNSIQPYNESSKLNPQCAYGRSKMLGEKAIIESECMHMIIRTAWVFSEFGNNFLKTMLRLSEDKRELRIINDQFGSPTYAMDIAKAVKHILNNIDPTKKYKEIYNFSGDVKVNWLEFSNYIFEKASDEKILKHTISIKPISTSEYNSKAHRPKYSYLDNSKIYDHWKIRPSDWRKGVLTSIKNLKK